MITAYALKLAPLLFVRPGELRHTDWIEFDFDSAEPHRRIPAEKMKMGSQHFVPLAKQALVLLRELQSVTGRGQYVFPSLRSGSRPMSENLVNAALRRMGYYSTDEITGHGFRWLASTSLNEQGYHPDLIELQLAHAERNQVRSCLKECHPEDDPAGFQRLRAAYETALHAARDAIAAAPPERTTGVAEAAAPITGAPAPSVAAAATESEGDHKQFEAALGNLDRLLKTPTGADTETLERALDAVLNHLEHKVWICQFACIRTPLPIELTSEPVNSWSGVMGHLWLSRLRIGIALFASLNASAAGAVTPIAWHTTWNDALFAQAAKERRFVLLDLHAVWCHWCHVMDETTYADADVERLVSNSYLAVSVDADSDPDLTSRYGNWGWPATIVLASDGTEIVKRRGYLAPQQMTSLLQAIIDDPSPGPSVQQAATPLVNADTAQLMPRQRTALMRTYDSLYDNRNGGWGRIHKLIDADSLELAYLQTDSNRSSLKATATRRARTTLDNNLKLIDPVWGGVYQYSDAMDWRSPHFEKLMSYQSDDLRLYVEGFARWRDPRYLAAATSLFVYIDRFLTAPDGGFYVSQDADVARETSGHEFYSHDDAMRRRLGMPKIDTHRYARESGWAIRALAKFYDVTGNQHALQSAQDGARWAISYRALPGGGFRHDQHDRGGPFLDDNLAMIQAFLALYRSTGERNWLTHADDTLDFVDRRLRYSDAGFVAAPAGEGTRGVFREPVRLPDQNAALVRAANMANRYTGNARYREIALHGMKYLVAFAAIEDGQLLPEILLADEELSKPPIHIAIVGSKQDPAAQALHMAALRYPCDYLQIDWLDRAEGDLPNRDIQYPDMSRAAAFACGDGACSPPVTEADEIDAAVRRALIR